MVVDVVPARTLVPSATGGTDDPTDCDIVGNPFSISDFDILESAVCEFCTIAFFLAIVFSCLRVRIPDGRGDTGADRKQTLLAPLVILLGVHNCCFLAAGFVLAPHICMDCLFRFDYIQIGIRFLGVRNAF